MCPKPVFYPALLAWLLLPFFAAAQKPLTPKSPPKTAIDSMMLESSVVVFQQSSISPDTTKATLRIRILEKGGDAQAVQGATVLLRRDKDKILGRVTKHDGRCLFAAAPATYTVRVQMTGLKTIEKTGFTLNAGNVYDMEIMMARN